MSNTSKKTRKGGRRRKNGVVVYPAWSAYMKTITKNAESQGAVSEKMGVSQTQISRWMRGLARPASVDAAVEVASKMGADVVAAERAFKADGENRGGRRAAGKKAAAVAPPARKAAKVPAAKAAAPARPVKAAAPKIDLPRPELLALPSNLQEGLDELIEAKEACREAERALDEAVFRVRAAGVPWPHIAKVLRGDDD